MKKLLAIVLFSCLAALPVSGYAAELTATNVDQLSIGNFAGVTGVVSVGNSGDTIPLRLKKIIFFTMSAESDKTGGNDATPFEYTVSDNTVTIYPEASGIRWRFFAIGTP